VSTTKSRLELSFDNDKQRVDTALATNMISVGLDISRLGLMEMLGQPKTTAEYIQASSRVGRDDQRPGLVVVLLNPNRPRDRSHYERFSFWHSVFYRDVEATSVTPWSSRALQRGLPAITVALARHLSPELSWAKDAGNADAIDAASPVTMAACSSTAVKRGKWLPCSIPRLTPISRSSKRWSRNSWPTGACAMSNPALL
jgi:hypothetical protein